MDTRHRQIENPVTKERIRFLETAHDTHRARLVFEQAAPPEMIAPPVHLHLGQQERFTVLEGEECVIDAKTAHTWWNSGTGLLRARAELRPAGGMQGFLETFCGLAQEGRSDARGQPPLLQITASERVWGMYLATPPVALQRLAMALLRPLAWLRGYRAAYARFEHLPARRTSTTADS